MLGRPDYQAAAHSLIQHEQTGQSVLMKLRQICPDLAAQIESDARHRPLLDLWGTSVNFDELANAQIVSPGITSAIGELAGMSCDGSVIHAGLLHTYGYLLSVIETPFGFKRDRWVNETLEAGLGIKHPVLRPWPIAGTLLSNVTFFLGRIAFRGFPSELALLRRHKSAVAPEIAEYPFRSLHITRIVEQVTLPTDSRIEVHIDFVELPQATLEPRYLLIYTIMDERVSRGSLITAFPVTRTVLDEYCAADSLGDRIPLRSRFNAFVDGWTGSTRIGRRFQIH